MTFINPLMLLGLGLIAVPVIIHLFNLRKAQKVNFSSLMFVRQIEETEIKKLRLKELILLLIRILLITFLVLSFANPVMESRFSLTDIKNKTALLFLDNSFSLNNISGKVNNFEECKSSASEISGLYNPTDNLRIFSGTNNLTVSSDIQGAEISHKPFFINEILETVNINLEKEKSILNEVIAVSDFSRANFKEYSGSGNYSADKDNIYFYLLDISEREPANISIQDVQLINQFPDLNTDMVFKVSIRNHNDFSVSSVEFEMSNNGSYAHFSNLDFLENELKEFEINFKPFAYGEQKIESIIKIPNPAEDEIKEDNRFFKVLSIPEEYRILLVSDNYKNASYIIKSFEVFNGADETGRINYILSNIISDEIYDYDALYLIKSGFTENDINLLEKFSSSGKGILIFPPANTDIQNINLLLKRISSLRIESKETNAENIKISEIKTEHSLFKGVFKSGTGESMKQNPESPVLKTYFKILSGENTYPVISFNNGAKFVSEYMKGHSRIILSALSPDFEMSDLPKKNFFLPMIIRGVFLLSNNDNILRTGRINSGVLFDGLRNGIDTVYKPDGTKIITAGNNGSNLSMIMDKYFNKSGFYRVINSKSEEKFYAVNNDINESFMQKINENSALEYFKLKGFSNVRYFNNIEDLKSAIEKNRKGIELTPFFLILAVIFIILEIIYSAFVLRRK
ncbi:MAG: BatA domain-containing protein [Ignavibacteria bacterium]|nr:BatA domain-containing protein [Ignavibacteria bacterium]